MFNLFNSKPQMEEFRIILMEEASPASLLPRLHLCALVHLLQDLTWALSASEPFPVTALCGQVWVLPTLYSGWPLSTPLWASSATRGFPNESHIINKKHYSCSPVMMIINLKDRTKTYCLGTFWGCGRPTDTISFPHNSIVSRQFRSHHSSDKGKVAKQEPFTVRINWIVLQNIPYEETVRGASREDLGETCATLPQASRAGQVKIPHANCERDLKTFSGV